MASTMSLIEEECRYAIAVAYAEWQWRKGWKGLFSVYASGVAKGFHLLAYERALGLDPLIERQEGTYA